MKESYSVLGTVQYPHPYPSTPLQNANLTSKGTYYVQLQCIWCCPRYLISALSLLLTAREREKNATFRRPLLSRNLWEKVLVNATMNNKCGPLKKMYTNYL